MDKKLVKEYLSLFLRSKIGLNLSLPSVYNYIRYTIKCPNVKIPHGYSYPMVSMYVTRRCNKSCHYCVVGKLESIKYNDFELTPCKYEIMLKNSLIKRTLLILFCGGEPLLNENICELISMTRKKGKISAILTNGILLQKKFDDLLKAGIADIQVSLYDDTIEVLKNNLQLMNKKMQMNASYVLLRSDFENHQEKLESVIAYALESGFKSLKFNFCLSNKNNNFIDESLKIEHKQKYDIFKAKMLKKYKYINIYFHNISENVDKKCKAPWNSLLVDAAGNFGFCCKHQPNVNENFNIFEKRWSEIINNELFSGWRAKLLADDKIIPEHCKGCYHLNGSYSSNI
ncbi:MAG: radical SAM protein [Endomicrobiaceae bacterium]|jgi:MoaA/NifB/PqqE/SkfB family radical SAM enzyme|nr:radical SAM protein [Endomicrobiaceae bacterium]